MLIGNPTIVQLTRSEFAAVRAYVQGMPAAMVVPRYLDGDDDDDSAGDSALRILLGLRDRMVQLAHLHGRPDLAVLLEQGPGRSNRGMDRRVDAVAELERLGTALPRADHGVELWFAPALARRLRAAGIDSLEALADAINRRGLGWWRAVPRIGALAAGAVNRWLLDHRDALKSVSGSPLLHAHIGAAAAQRAAVFGPELQRPVPLEWLTVIKEPEPSPNVLAGADAPGDAFAADLVAVHRWLAGFRTGSPTWLAYRKEAERLLLWCAIERQSPLGSLTGIDGDAYARFLCNPAPAERWIGPRAARHSVAWRPFAAPLSPASVRHALRVIGAMQQCMLSEKDIFTSAWRPLPSAAGRLESGGPPSTMSIDLFLSWMRQQGTAAQEARLRASEAAILVARGRGLRFDSLCRVTAAAVFGAGGWAPSLTAPEKAALERHWRDRGLPWGDASMHEMALIGPVALPPTGRARRKAEAAPGSGYSPRGLHALITHAIERYRLACDPDFPVRCPRDLMKDLPGR